MPVLCNSEKGSSLRAGVIQKTCWRRKTRAKGRSAQKGTGEGEDSSALSYLQNALPSFPGASQPSMISPIPSLQEGSLILQVPPGQWGMQVGQDLFLEKFKKFFRRREWGRWPLPASPFCFLSQLVYWKGGVFRPSLFLSWYGKKSTKPGIRNPIQILTPSPAKCVALGRLFSFPGLRLLKKKMGIVIFIMI